ncbi:MAG: BREX system ATP-binding domain-containing protein [Chloroflexota bacterium]
MSTTMPIISKRYLLHQQIGQGGMGAVYLALDRLTGQNVALKRVLVSPKNLSFSTYDPATDLRLALAQEFRVMSSLRHPNIASVLDYGFDDERQPYFTMEFLDNAQALNNVYYGSDQEKANALIQVLQALAYLHRRGIIHRDLKPSNILVVGEQIKVLDFGVSLNRDEINPDSDVIAGTLDFMAPEILLGDSASEASDLYAVGVIGYELFTGKRLWQNFTINSLSVEILNWIPNVDEVTHKHVASVLLTLLSKSPEDRYANAEEAIIALSEAIDQPPPTESAAIRESFLQAATFVGREAELKQLVDTLTEATQGHGSVWLIGGESGVGKTRLLDEVRTQALVQGVLVLRGYNISEGSSLYQMWRAALRWLCLLTELSDEDAGVLKALVPDIETLLGRKIADAPPVSAAFAQERLLLALENLFRQQRQPILLILEDLHWAGSESIALLTRLNHFIGDLALVVVCLYRDDERPELVGMLPEAQVLKLHRLDKTSIVELSAAMLGDKGRQPALLDLLQRETEGNVFFLVEIVRALAEQAGQLDAVGNMALPEHVFAGGVSQIVQRRLDRVPAEHRALLQLAAITGRQLDLKILQQLVDATVNLDQWLAICANTAVLEVQDGTWRFAHDKLRDGVLKDLPDDKSRELHRQVATQIETVYLYAPEYTASATYHWTMAGDTAKEAHYATLAGKQALASSAYQEAVKFLDRALVLVSTENADEKKRGDLKRQLGEAYMGLNEPELAKQMIQDSLDIFKAIPYRWGIASALNDLGNVYFSLGRFQEAMPYFREALQTAMSTRAIPVALASIVGIASLLAEDKQCERALTLATFILHHSITDKPTAYRAERLLQEMKVQLPPETAHAAEEKGNATSMAEVAKEILGT